MADILSISVDDLKDAEKVKNLVKSRNSFQVVGIRNMSSVVQTLESIIETQGMKVRVYTEFRSAGLGGFLLPTGITQITALGTAIGTAVHNVCTFNPDYEIAKNVPMSRVKVLYKK